MNKKFTFMVAALLAAGSFSANAADFTLKTAPVEIKKGAQVYLVVDNDAEPKSFSAGDLALGIELSKDGKDLSAVTANNNGSTFNSGDNKVTNYLWTVEESEEAGTKYFAFKNSETGKYLAFKENGSLQTTAADATAAKSTIYFEYDATSHTLKAKKLEGKVVIADNTVALQNDDASEIYAYSADSKTVTAKELNAVMGGDGFSLAPVESSNAVDDANNVFAQQIKAVCFEQHTYAETNEIIGSTTGLYFVVEVPETLKINENGVCAPSLYLDDKDWNDATSKEQEKALEAYYEDFSKCKFIAVSSYDSYQTSEVNSNGLKLITISGADLIKFDQTIEDGKYATTKEQVYAGNAVFTVTEPDQYAKPGEYELSVKGARIKDAGKDSHSAASLNIGVTKIAGTNYVTTLDKPTSFKVSTSSLYDGMKLLNTTKEASVYTIQFVSGKGVENSEYGKHLGVAVDNSQIFVAQGEDLIDINLPQYKFVVTNVAADKTVTFKNIETGATFNTQLYATDVEGQYKLIGADQKVRIAEEAAKTIDNYSDETDMTSMVVELTPVKELDNYAGFFKKGIDNNESYRLVFAKNATTDDKLYVAENTDKTKNATVLSASRSLQVVFEPVLDNNKNIDEEYVTTQYAYNNGGKVYYASEKLVKYYTYKMRLVDAENKYLDLTTGASTMLTVVTGKNAASEVIVKGRYDGSVSLISANELANNTNLALSLNQNNAGKYVYSSVEAYNVPNLDAVNLFLEEEKVGVSLPAASGHFTFEAENGGFMNVSNKNEGVIAIRTEAAEDLTFWLDTTNSEKLIPSFYISKGGKFMYNSTDSLKAYDKNLTAGKVNPYKIYSYDGYEDSNAKAIFKASTLVNSDTLKTIVDNKEVVVAEDADQNRGILGGIKNFQFNIVKASDSEDNYVIRNGWEYLANFNGVLGFITNKENAMRVIVEGAAAPTSNEGVSASEVKVIANNGSINVKNAAGKNVVVSTILGQVVANEVLTSDNATINVPAGIVVVAVEGESFKVNVK